MLTTRIRTSGLSARIRLVASTPSCSGIRRSITITSRSAGGGLRNRLPAIGRLADQLGVGHREHQRTQTVPEQQVIVGDQDAEPVRCRRLAHAAPGAGNGSTALTTTPPLLDCWIEQSPPSSRARWRIDWMPYPSGAVSLNPTPSSVTFTLRI